MNISLALNMHNSNSACYVLFALPLTLSRSRCTRLTADATLYNVSFILLFVPAGRKLGDHLVCELPQERGHKLRVTAAPVPLFTLNSLLTHIKLIHMGS